MADSIEEEDIRHDDLEFEPQLDPKKAKAWINLLTESEDAFEAWNNQCDKLDKQYGNIQRLASMGRNKEFQMFWANIEVIKPATYFKAPEPVVVTKFKDRRPVPQAAAEFLERCCTVAFDLAYINETMLQIRDDLCMTGRGVAWCRYESGKENGSYYDSERVCIEFKHRRDFLHSLSRCWHEVWWVAAASYLTRSEARERFYKYSGDEYQDAEYKVDKDSQELGGGDARERAKFWEIWDKKNRRVVWVAEGCEFILDEDDPHLDVQGFFPCPKPAYGTLQRGSLVPVPDSMQYQDQLDEVNNLTAKIHALTQALEAKGFYPAGGGELAEAIEAAIRINTPGRVMVPISNWSAFGGSKEVIIWMPIEEVASTITQCVALRKEIIQDIYQIMGLSDIMRGATDARETLGAQQLKTQYGSSRIRDKQYEMVRIARDLVCITSDIITEQFDPVTMIQMSQTQLPTEQMQQRDAQKAMQNLMQQQQQLQQMQTSPQAQQLMQQKPGEAQQAQNQAQGALQQGYAEIQRMLEKPNIQQVLTFLKNHRSRSFVLDIETDSTIQVDENAEKQQRAEFTGMLSQLLPQLVQMITAEPRTTNFAGETLKFSVAPFRAGRALDGSIDDLVATMTDKADQPRPDDPMTVQAKTAKEIEQMKIDYQKQKDQSELQLKQQEIAMKDQHSKMKIQSDQAIEMAKLQGKQQEEQAKAQQTNMKAMAEREKAQQQQIKTQSDIRLQQQKADLAVRQAQMKHTDMMARANERQAAQQFRQQQQATRGFPS